MIQKSAQFLYLSHLPVRFQQELLKTFSISHEPNPDEITRSLRLFPWEKVKSEANSLDKCLFLGEQTQKKCLSLGIQYVSIWSENYPEKIKQADSPPLVLFFKGSLPQKKLPTLSIVGTRQPDLYGSRVCAQMLSKLNLRELQIVSGLAYGIDSIAHQTACEMNIPNFAVLGNGLESVYPENHTLLAKKILSTGGGLLSEFTPECEIKAFHFPRRNRIISALCDVLWVIQGTFKSGTRHTIEFACKQGKTVAASPGEIFNGLSEIPNRLILEGAHCILSQVDLEILLRKL